MKITLKRLSVLGLMLLSGATLTACGTSQQANKQGTANTTNQSNITYASSANRKLANMKYKPGKSAIVTINHNHAQLSKNWKQDKVDYAKMDKLSRTSNANTGWLDKQNVANDSLRTKQTFKPTGYHQKFVNNQPILNRGHEIAYSLSKGISQSGKYNPKAQSGDQNNPKNLFTQTAFSNQELQTIYESKVRNALKSGAKVIYQVQPIFKGKDRMANGVHMQALSTNGKLNYNVYLYNVQPGVKFNYLTGKASIDRTIHVPTPKGAPHFNDNSNNNNNWNMNNRHHHYIRHYAEYRMAKHIIRKHTYYRRGYHSPRHMIRRHR